ncbi:transposase, partial [Streptomyces sp. NRRL F-2664]|uniref:transposase n=1 Tax=Streptomyces sp. NRRL F-2664 TaxID=1463842 RepID=UPI00131CEA62
MVPEEAVLIMSGKSGKRCTAEFKKDAVELVLSTGRIPAGVARELGVGAEGLRSWVKQAKTDRGQGPAGALANGEREELRRVRRELAEVKRADEILVEAAAFFAKEIVERRVPLHRRGEGMRRQSCRLPRRAAVPGARPASV